MNSDRRSGTAETPPPASPGILSCAYAVPPTTRGDDDPVYRRLDRTPDTSGTSEADLFTGAGRRHVLAPDESIDTFMLEASERALAEAGVSPGQVDRLYGYASVPEYATPNPLYRLHGSLGLRTGTLVVPVNSEFSTFALGVLQASEAIRAGSCSIALVAVGSGWTRNLDYTRGHAQAASDAAAAAVVGPDGALALVGHATRTESSYYESMTMGVRVRTADGWSGIPVDAAGTPVPTYEMHPEMGLEVYRTVMWDGVPRLVEQLLGEHGVTPGEVALVTHQGSRTLLDHWAEQVRPAQHLETFAELGNMTSATYPVSLAYHWGTIIAPYVVVVSVGTGFHLTAILLRRRSG